MDLPRYVKACFHGRAAGSTPRDFIFLPPTQTNVSQEGHSHATVCFLGDTGEGITTLYRAQLHHSQPVSWERLVDPHNFSTASHTLTKEELLLRERMRTVDWGITEYRYCKSDNSFLVSCEGELLVLKVRIEISFQLKL